MSKWRKKDFQIVGRRTGSVLRGRENEYVYEIFWQGKRLGDYMFTSKRKADTWLGQFLRKANEIRGRA